MRTLSDLSFTVPEAECHDNAAFDHFADNHRYQGVSGRNAWGNEPGFISSDVAADLDRMAADEAKAKARRTRDSRYRALAFLREHAASKSVRACSFVRIRGDEGVGVVVKDGRAHLTNLRRCGMVHVCPVCSPKVRQARADEIAVGLAVHRALGGGVQFVTLTLQHDRAERLAPLLDLVAGGFRAVIGTGRWVREWYLEREAFGIVGTIRSLEITHGLNGWHPHLHVLVLTRTPLGTEDQELLTDGFWRRWSGFLADRGHHGTTRELGIVSVAVVSDGDVARYMAKTFDTLANELGRADLKTGKRSGRNPFGILGALVEAGRADQLTGEINPDWFVWREYELATKGRNSVTWSHGLKARLGVTDVSDAEHAEADVGGEHVATIGGSSWWAVRHRPDRLAQVLTAAELHGEAGVYELLDCWLYATA